MIKHTFSADVPGLLVSVRDASEALVALAGGADVIDVKEPSRGALGPADPQTIAAVVRAVNGRVPVTAAAGELLDIARSADATSPFCQPTSIPTGVSLFKIGLAGCGTMSNWPTIWRQAIATLTASAPSRAARPVAVVYADWRTAGAPDPDRVLSAAIEIGCPALLIDTWDKSAGVLFDHWPMVELNKCLRRARAQEMVVVLAGSLAGQSFSTAVRLLPDLVAVRGAACEAGRGGTLSLARVRSLRQAITAAELPAGMTRTASLAKDFS